VVFAGDILHVVPGDPILARIAGSGVIGADLNQRFRMGIRERVNEHRFHGGEDNRYRSGSHGDGENGNGRDCWHAKPLAAGLAEVGEE
jgi:hypothetical protein